MNRWRGSRAGETEVVLEMPNPTGGELRAKHLPGNAIGSVETGVDRREGDVDGLLQRAQLLGLLGGNLDTRHFGDLPGQLGRRRPLLSGRHGHAALAEGQEGEEKDAEVA